VKLPVVLTVDALIGLAYGKEQPLPCLYANRVNIPKATKLLEYTQHRREESMLDVAVYRGISDPYSPLATAESEASSNHEIRESSGSEASGYLWDLFKLLQVPSPLRLFVTRTSRLERCRTLERRVRDLIGCYSDYFRDDDRIFSIVLPTAAREFESFRCYGWVKRTSLEPLEAAVSY
jgi:hypothetical protein